MTRRILAPILLVAAIVAPGVTPYALAQSSNPGAIQAPGFRPNQGAKPDRTPRQPAPPALPGSRAEPTAVAPAERTSAEMPPTEALFDSVNRGDLTGAREAISRGADLQGVNVLGLTPLELSVDLGRNEISFLLLSLRGGSGYSASRPAEAAPPSRAPTRAERVAAERAALREQRANRVSGAAANAAPLAPRLFAGDGGAPIPQAGFLGFDAGR